MTKEPRVNLWYSDSVVDNIPAVGCQHTRPPALLEAVCISLAALAAFLIF